MTRSLKKGPFIDYHLQAKIDKAVEIAPLKEITNKKTGWWSK